MLNFKSCCFALVLTGLLIAGTSCSKVQPARYISENDTTYSAEIRDVSKKINADPVNAELYFKRSNAFFYEDNFKQAVLDVEYAITLDSINPIYHFNRGKYLMSGDTANAIEAEKSYKNAIRLAPSFYKANSPNTSEARDQLLFDAHTALAYLLLAKQKYDESEQHYIEANKISPSDPKPYFYMGIMAKEMKDTAKAIALFEKTLVYDARHYDALMQLGNYYAFKKDKKALLFLDKAISVNEFSDEALYAKALFLQNEGKYRDAAALYELVAKMNPTHIFCRYNLAYINGLFHNYDDAIKLLDETIDLAPDYADAYALRGAMEERLNNSTGAFNDYNRALQLDENQKMAKEGIKRINISISGPK